jgi:hypothetical protein
MVYDEKVIMILISSLFSFKLKLRASSLEVKLVLILGLLEKWMFKSFLRIDSFSWVKLKHLREKI